MNLGILKTLFIYGIAEFVAVYFMYLANKKRNQKQQSILFQSKRPRIKISNILICLIASFLPLFLLAALKSNTVGADTNSYALEYYAIGNNFAAWQDSYLSIGFKSLAAIFNFLHIDYHIFYACIVFTTLLLFYQVIWKYSKNPALSIFILLSTCLFFQMFNQYRQMLAIAIVFFSYNFLTPKRNFWKFSITILLAASIHTSALIFLLIFLISKINLNRVAFLLYLLSSIASFGAFPIIASILLITHYGQGYLNSGFDISFRLSTILNLGVRCALLGFALLSLLRNKRQISHSYQTLTHIAIICTIVQLLTMRSYLFGRITTYFFIFYLLLIPNILVDYYHQKKSILYLAITGCILYQFAYYNSSVAIASKYREYTFFFESSRIQIPERTS